MSSPLRERQDKALAFYQKMAFTGILLAVVSCFMSFLSLFETSVSSGLCYGFVYWLRDSMFMSQYGGQDSYWLNNVAFVLSSILVSVLMGYLAYRAVKAKTKEGIAYLFLLVADFVFAYCYVLTGEIDSAGIMLLIVRAVALILGIIALVAYIRLYKTFAEKEKQ